MAPDEDGPALVGEGPFLLMSVNITPKTSEAVTAAAALSGDSRTDVVNRACQLYVDLLQAAHAESGTVTRLREVGPSDLMILTLR